MADVDSRWPNPQLSATCINLFSYSWPMTVSLPGKLEFSTSPLWEPQKCNSFLYCYFGYKCSLIMYYYLSLCVYATWSPLVNYFQQWFTTALFHASDTVYLNKTCPVFWKGNFLKNKEKSAKMYISFLTDIQCVQKYAVHLGYGISWSPTQTCWIKNCIHNEHLTCR